MPARPPIYDEGKMKIGFAGLLTILFIALKLTDVITWSWWWVLSPIWIPILLVICIICIAGIIDYNK
jgi:hypothetical protein